MSNSADVSRGIVHGELFRFVVMLLIVLFLAGQGLSASNARLIEFDVETDVAGDSERGSDWHVGEVLRGGRPGEPVLAYSVKRVLLPDYADLKTLVAELSDGEWRELAGECEIAPVPPAATWGDNGWAFDWGGKDPAIMAGGRDTSVYGEDNWLPGDPVEIIGVSEFRQWKVVQVRIWHEGYSPVQKKMRVLSNARVRISVTRPDQVSASGVGAGALLPDKGGLKETLLDGVVNPQDYEEFYGAESVVSGQGGVEPLGAPISDYVIITANSVVSNSTKLSSFVSDKQAQGYTVKVVSQGAVADDTHYLTSGSADERANNIRAWLQGHYLSDGIVYVLLIGNPHPSTFTSGLSIPMKMCWPRNGAGFYEQAPTDMFYADLSNTWDLDGDGFYGEYPDDYGPGGADKDCEVYVGRIPCYGSYTELDAILQKTMDYTSEAGSRSWRKKVLIPTGILNFSPQDNNGDGDATDPGDFADPSLRTFGPEWAEDVKTLAVSAGWPVYTLYERKGYYHDGSAYSLTRCNADSYVQNVIHEWKNNNYGFVTWLGHGTATEALRLC